MWRRRRDTTISNETTRNFLATDPHVAPNDLLIRTRRRILSSVFCFTVSTAGRTFLATL